MQRDWSEGRTKAKGGAEKEGAEKMNEENQRRCCIRQDKGREAACEDQKND
jgi:hypothetical protein